VLNRTEECCTPRMGLRGMEVSGGLNTPHKTRDREGGARPGGEWRGGPGRNIMGPPSTWRKDLHVTGPGLIGIARVGHRPAENCRKGHSRGSSEKEASRWNRRCPRTRPRDGLNCDYAWRTRWGGVCDEAQENSTCKLTVTVEWGINRVPKLCGEKC